MNNKDIVRFNYIFDQNYLELRQFIINYCNDFSLVDDILYDTFTNLYDSFNEVKNLPQYKEWIYARAIEYTKKLEKKNNVKTDGEVFAESIDKNTVKEWVLKNLDIIQRLLTDEEYRFIYLYYIDNYTCKEVIDMMNLSFSPETLQTHLTHITTKLQEKLKESLYRDKK